MKEERKREENVKKERERNKKERKNTKNGSIKASKAKLNCHLPMSLSILASIAILKWEVDR